MKSTTAADEPRRTAVMNRLVPLIKRGVDKHLQEKQAVVDKNPGSAFIPRWNHEMYLLRHNALANTVLMLATYQTETLEHIAEKFAKPRDLYDCLHMWLSYNGDEWNTVAGEHRDAMLRDFLVLDRNGRQPAESLVYILPDVYRALGLAPGSIYQMSPEEIAASPRPVFFAASASRVVVRLRNKPGKRDAPNIAYEDYKGDHLRDEIVQYVIQSSEHCNSLTNYMVKNRKTLPELDFDYFLEHVSSHASLAEGVL